MPERVSRLGLNRRVPELKCSVKNRLRAWLRLLEWLRRGQLSRLLEPMPWQVLQVEPQAEPQVVPRRVVVAEMWKLQASQGPAARPLTDRRPLRVCLLPARGPYRPLLPWRLPASTCHLDFPHHPLACLLFHQVFPIWACLHRALDLLWPWLAWWLPWWEEDQEQGWDQDQDQEQELEEGPALNPGLLLLLA